MVILIFVIHLEYYSDYLKVKKYKSNHVNINAVWFFYVNVLNGNKDIKEGNKDSNEEGNNKDSNEEDKRY